MTVFILPTKGPATYRGKYPTRARSLGVSGNGGAHIELNNGVRLWTMNCGPIPSTVRNADYAAILASAVPMSAEQYAELLRAAELDRSIIGIAGNTRRESVREQARAIRLAIKALPQGFAIKPRMGRFDVWEGETVANEGTAWGFDSEGAARKWIAEYVANREADAAATVEPEAPAAPVIKLQGFEVRRDNVEYNAGRDAKNAGKPRSAMPYLPGGNREFRWNLGWDEGVAPAALTVPLFVVTSRTIDGTEYFGPLGWGDRQLAAVMSEADATAIAAKEEERAAPIRNPETGRYQIKAAPYQGPSLYTVADYDAAESFSGQMESLYGHMFREGPEA